MAGTDAQWSKAFATQALADLSTRDLLADLNAPKCHRLQFLQMSAEKLCKAFLINANGLDEMTFKHCIIAKNLPIVLRHALTQQGRSPASVKAYLPALRHLSKEIELLSPSCDATGNRPDNAEYPWISIGGAVDVPAAFSFPNLTDDGRSFVLLTKLMRTAAETYLV